LRRFCAIEEIEEIEEVEKIEEIRISFGFQS